MQSDYLPTMIRMYNHGMPMAKIAKHFGCSYSWVHKSLTGRVQFRSRHHRSLFCVDGCGRKLQVGKRCPFHRRVRLAEVKRNWARTKRGADQRPLLKDFGYE